MLLAGGMAEEEAEARQKLQKAIEDGSALRKLAQFVEAQGGDPKAVYEPELLPKAEIIQTIPARLEGYVHSITCDEIGICSLLLGGGRETKESEIDLSVGLVLCKKVGDYVKAGEPLAYIHANDKQKLQAAIDRFYPAYHISQEQPEKKPMIKGILQ